MRLSLKGMSGVTSGSNILAGVFIEWRHDAQHVQGGVASNQLSANDFVFL